MRRRRGFNKAAYRSSDEAWREQLLLLLGAAPLCGLAASPADCRGFIRNIWAARNSVDQAHGCFDFGRELLFLTAQGDAHPPLCTHLKEPSWAGPAGYRSAAAIERRQNKARLKKSQFGVHHL